MQKELQVGVLTKPHGVHGAVKVFPTTDDTRRFKKGQEFILERKKERRTVKVEKVQTSGQFVVLKFEGFETPEEIAPYASCPLLVDREHAVALKKDEYFKVNRHIIMAINCCIDFFCLSGYRPVCRSDRSDD